MTGNFHQTNLYIFFFLSLVKYFSNSKFQFTQRKWSFSTTTFWSNDFVERERKKWDYRKIDVRTHFKSDTKRWQFHIELFISCLNFARATTLVRMKSFYDIFMEITMVRSQTKSGYSPTVRSTIAWAVKHSLFLFLFINTFTVWWHYFIA